MSNVGAELHGLARRIATMPKEMVQAGAKQLREPLLTAIARDSGGEPSGPLGSARSEV